jgi:hypothetical protein
MKRLFLTVAGLASAAVVLENFTMSVKVVGFLLFCAVFWAVVIWLLGGGGSGSGGGGNYDPGSMGTNNNGG